MKKFFATLFTAAVLALSSLCFTACGSGAGDEINVYTPDGAPALSMAMLMENDEQFGEKVVYKVVEATTIQTYVTGETPKADLCVLPINSASKLLGTGTAYKMLGTVTHGNLFLMAKKGAEKITADNLSSLVGKTVGVINLAAVPGLTFKLILKENGIAYNELGNDGTTDDAKVNLKAVNATEVIPSNADCDYFVVPEPAATTKQKATCGALGIVGNLQNLYNAENGYPQAVLVAKASLIQKNAAFISRFIEGIKNSAGRLLDEDAEPQRIVAAVQAHLSAGMSPAFTAANLDKTVIENCAISFVKSADCKEEVKAFIEKLIGVNAGAAAVPSDDFFYNA